MSKTATITVQKWGNSLAVRVQAAFVAKSIQCPDPDRDWIADDHIAIERA